MRIILIIATLAIAPLSATAQWSGSVTVARWSAAGHAESADGTALRPDGGNVVAFALARRLGAWRVAAGARYTEAGLAVSGHGSTLISDDAMKSWAGTAEVQHDIAGDGYAPTARLAVGAEVARWTFSDVEDKRTRVGAFAAFEGAVSIRGPWRIILRGEAAVSGSLFKADELPDGYSVRRGMRHGIAVGIERSL